MTRLIDAEALKKKLQYVYSCEYIGSKSKEGIVSDIIDAIDNAPTVEAVPLEFHEKVMEKTVGELIECQSNLRPKGKWKKDENGIDRCSECGNRCITFVMGKPRDKFCIECGAEMEADNETRN